MICPFCRRPGTRMETHAHLGADHGDQVRMFRSDAKDQLRFALDCPFCEEGLERIANPRGREPGFLEEFRREIALVAFDLLLYHMQAAHRDRVALPPDEDGEAREPEPAAGTPMLRPEAQPRTVRASAPTTDRPTTGGTR